jgi:hypothetical protein
MDTGRTQGEVPSNEIGRAVEHHGDRRDASIHILSSLALQIPIERLNAARESRSVMGWTERLESKPKFAQGNSPNIAR